MRCFVVMLTAAHVALFLQICPYYGSRRAVPGADVVLAPYNAVLMPDARDSLGIELQDSVLVFDEAHNLLDALNSAHSTTVTGNTQAVPAAAAAGSIMRWAAAGCQCNQHIAPTCWQHVGALT